MVRGLPLLLPLALLPAAVSTALLGLMLPATPASEEMVTALMFMLGISVVVDVLFSPLQ